MKSKNDRAKARAPKRQFRIENLEERIAPKKYTACAGDTGTSCGGKHGGHGVY